MRQTLLLLGRCAGLLLSLSAGAAERWAATVPEFRQLQRVLQPGDSLVLRAGVWRDADLVFAAHGRPGQPITLRAAHPGAVHLTGRSRLRLAGEHLVVSGLLFKDATDPREDVIEFRAAKDRPASFSRVTDCAIMGFNPPDRGRDFKWLSLYGVSNRVDHCYLAGKSHAGTTLVVWLDGRPNYHRIDHNFFGPRPPLGQNGGETIRVGDSQTSLTESRTLVELNRFERCNGEVEIISNKSGGNIYRRNTFVDCEGALTLRHGNGCVVTGNFFFGNGRKHTGGVRVVGEDHQVVNNYFAELGGEESRSALTLMNGLPDSPLHGYFQVKRATVAFNTFVRCRSTLMIGLPGSGSAGATLAPRDVVFANNVVVVDNRPVISRLETATPVKWEGNWGEGVTGLPAVDGWTLAALKLEQASDGLWRPGADSPVVGAAVGSWPAVTDDIDGQPRTGRLDAGCDQVYAAPRRRPMGALETGPSWRQPAVPAPAP